MLARSPSNRFLQKTLKSAVVFQGIALHSGAECTVKVSPSKPGSGIVFLRSDMANCPVIQAVQANIVNTQLATTIGFGQYRISTVEHLLAAIVGLGIDNARIEVSGPEVPIMDGSSMPFVEKFVESGIEIQIQKKSVLRIKQNVEVRMGEKWAIAEPSNDFEIHASIEWDHPSVGFQEFSYVAGETDFVNEIAPARTFCLLRDVDALKKLGLIKGGSLENAVVLDEANVLNPEGLRFADEFVRHKLLDAIGDLKFHLGSGLEMVGLFRFHRAGHDVHSRLLKTILSNPDHFEILTASAFESMIAKSVSEMGSNPLKASTFQKTTAKKLAVVNA